MKVVTWIDPREIAQAMLDNSMEAIEVIQLVSGGMTNAEHNRYSAWAERISGVKNRNDVRKFAQLLLDAVNKP